jgi:hypothetical protein
MPSRPDVNSSTTVDKTTWEQVDQVHYDPASPEDLCTTLVYALAEVRDVDPLDYESMPPLFESVDVGILEREFFDPDASSAPRDVTGSKTFRYGPQRVTVRSDGWIIVYEPLRAEARDRSS